MKEIYDNVALKCSKLTTTSYSTSFSMGIRFLYRKFHDPVYSIYGFVRFADEIVDSFHGFDKRKLLQDFRNETYRAIEEGISLNPILHSFQQVVNDFKIDKDLIDSFLHSMEMDLEQSVHDQSSYEEYILGSAEAVGLMCLKVFVEGDQTKYDELKFYAMRLGSAFQKINFLRDLQADYKEMGRSYFPGIDMENFDEEAKEAIEKDIAIDFQDGFEGIKRLPKAARFGVYIAYVYYLSLFNKIRSTPSNQILNERIRIPNNRKYMLFVRSYLRHSLNRI